MRNGLKDAERIYDKATGKPLSKGETNYWDSSCPKIN